MNNAIIPYGPQEIQNFFGFTLSEANQWLALVRNGMDVYQAARQIAPAITEDMNQALAQIQERINQIQPGRPGPGVYEDYFRRNRNRYLVNNQGEARYDITPNEIRETTISATGEGTHTRWIDPEDINPGTFIIQFAQWRAQHNQLKNKKQMKQHKKQQWH